MPRQEFESSGSPTAMLAATTQEAARALGGQSDLRITAFPCKVGRESRTAASQKSASGDVRLGTAPQLNDVYLIEAPDANLHLMHISKKHFAIEYAGDQFFLLDLRSACGTIVAGTCVGGDRTGGRIALKSGDEIVVGADESPYVFRFEVAPD